MSPGELATKEDMEKLKEELRQEIRELRAQREEGSSSKKKWLSTREVQEYIDVSTSTLHNLRAKGVLHPGKLGGTLYYEKAEIDSAIKNGQFS